MLAFTRRRRLRTVAVAVPIAVTVTVVVPAVAQVPGRSAPGAPPSAVFSSSDPGFAAGDRRARDRLQGRLGAVAKERRRLSRQRFRGLSRKAALEAGRDRFREEFTGRHFDGAEPSPGLKVGEQRGAGTALVEDERGQKVLLTSSMPLQARDAEGRMAPVDLSLDEGELSYVTENSNADLRIYKRAAGGVKFGGAGFTIAPQAASEATTGTDESDRVFYQDVAEDTGFVVAPRAMGAELAWLILSPAAPERFVLDVDVPEGGQLRRATASNPIPGDPPDSFEITNAAGNGVGYVYPPLVYDAAGVPVPSDFAIDGSDRIVVTVEHRGEDLEYPLYADPEVGIPNSDFFGFPGWRSSQVPATAFEGNNYYGVAVNNCAYYCNGLYLSMPTRTTYDRTGTSTNWYYQAPANTYIYRGVLGNMAHAPYALNFGGTIYVFSRWFNGLLGTSNWEANVNYANQSGGLGPNPFGPASHGASGATHDFCQLPRCNRAGGTEQNRLSMGLAAQNDVNTARIDTGTNKATMTANYSNVFLGDRRPPTMSSPRPPDRDWVDDTDNPAHTLGTVSASDLGLGVNGITLAGAASGNGTLRPPACSGDPNRSPCPSTFSTGGFSYQLNEGVTSLSLQPQDIVDNQGAPQTWTEKIDRTKPDLGEPSGSLYSARNRGDDNRFEGVYGPSATLNATATDAGSGVREIEVYFDGISQRLRGGYSASGTLSWTWNLATNPIPDGTYKVEIVARDSISGQPGAPASRHEDISDPFFITVDRVGDVYAAQYASDDPETGADIEVREWARAGSSTARREVPNHSVSTRSSAPCPEGATDRACESVRVRTRIGSAPFNDTDAFTVERGDADDSDLRNISQLLAPGRDSGRPVVETGDLVAIARPWQTLPPAHGIQFERYDFTEQRSTSEPADGDGGQSSPTETFTQRLYVDAATKMPVRQVELDDQGNLVDETFWTYETDRKEPSSYPSDFFSVAEPAAPEQRIEVQQERTRPISTVRDRETDSTFQPWSFGPTLDLSGLGLFCMARNDLNLAQRPPRDADEVPVGEEDPDIPEALPQAAHDTFVTTAYHLKLGTDCRPGLRPDDLVFTVTTFAKASTEAAAWRQVFAEDSAAPDDPDSPTRDREGRFPITVDGIETVVHLVPGAEDITSALLDLADATVMITGPLDSTLLGAIASQLRRQG